MKTVSPDPDKKSGVVVYLDALGTREYTDEENKTFILKKKKFLKDAKDCWKKREGQFANGLDSGLKWHLPNPEIATFQDSIIICWSDKEENQNYLPTYLSAGQWLIDFIPSVMRDHQIFFRGAISIGNYYFDTSKDNVTVLGKPVIDAIQSERLADWIGVIQTEACKDKYLKFLKSEERTVNPQVSDETTPEMIKHYAFLYVPYHIPLKNDVDAITKKKYFALSWPFWACKLGLSFSQLTSNVYEYVSEEIKPKYNNANEFFEWYKKNIFPEIPKS